MSEFDHDVSNDHCREDAVASGMDRRPRLIPPHVCVPSRAPGLTPPEYRACTVCGAVPGRPISPPSDEKGQPTVITTEPSNVYEELGRLRKAARLALAFSYHVQSLARDETEPMTAGDVAAMAAGAVPSVWAGLAKDGFISRPSEATVALAVELLASAARHPAQRS